MRNYLEMTLDEAGLAHRRRRNSADSYAATAAAPPPDGLGTREQDFLAARDSVYIATVGADGWPYVQHRGGPRGFITVLDPTHLAWVERRGNRQFLTAGHLDDNGRLALIAVDYPNRRRLKLMGQATFDPAPTPSTLRRLNVEGPAEGVLTIEVLAYDWNCPAFITPRFTREQLPEAIEPLRARIAHLEATLCEHGVDPGRGPAAARSERAQPASG